MRFILGYEIGSIIHEFMNLFLLPAYIIVSFLLMDYLKLQIATWERQYDYDEDFRNRFQSKNQIRARDKVENAGKGTSQACYWIYPQMGVHRSSFWCDIKINQRNSKRTVISLALIIYCIYCARIKLIETEKIEIWQELYCEEK